MLTYHMRGIYFYTSESGRCPVKEYLDNLTGSEAKKVTWVLKLFEETHIVPGKYFKKLTGSSGLWEIRIRLAGGFIRLLGFFDSDTKFIITSGFTKKSQKTPEYEIRTAEERKRSYYIRRMNE